jgi:single-strand DNA-binding protein
MPSVNRVILIGHLGRDPEIKHTAGDRTIANASLATSDTWKDKAGEKQERTEWHRLVFFDKLAEIVGQYVKKGSAIYVEGRLQTREWQDKEGAKRYTTEIVCDRMQMLGGKGRADEQEHEPERSKGEKPIKAPSKFDSLSDDIPF